MVFQQLLALDAQIFTAINSAHTPAMDFFFSNISHLGSIFFWVFLAALVFFRKDKKLFFELAAGLLLAGIISGGLKIAVNRPRPFDALANVHLLDPKPDPSFPSNHSANAFLGAGIFYKNLKKFKIFFYVLAVLVVFSRIYVGAHYPSDVIAGAFLGWLSFWIVSKYRLGEKISKRIGQGFR